LPSVPVVRGWSNRASTPPLERISPAPPFASPSSASLVCAGPMTSVQSRTYLWPPGGGSALAVMA
uniref:Clade I nitrous oxide reductase n=1 Tax=Schistocephalus solidus TaxID=70667 RepID=A0A183TQE0_SCHSO